MLTFVSVSLSACSVAQHTDKLEPMVIQQQGSFAAGGTVMTNLGTFDSVKMSPEGQTLHGDHLYAFYQIPANARKFPMARKERGGLMLVPECSNRVNKVFEKIYELNPQLLKQ